MLGGLVIGPSEEQPRPSWGPAPIMVAKHAKGFGMAKLEKPRSGSWFTVVVVGLLAALSVYLQLSSFAAAIGMGIAAWSGLS